MTKILVTGGAGFIGSHLVEYWQGRAEVRVLDNLRTGFIHNIKGFDCDLMEGSIVDPATAKKAVQGIDYVFHLAAMVSVPESMLNPVECVHINTLGTLNVLRACAEAGVKKLCFSSSAAIYGDNPTVPKIETMLPEPKSPYAVTKLDGEHYCQMFQNEGWLHTACMRYFNVFGPRQDPRNPYAAAIPIFIEKALNHQPITIFGDGGQTRDFIYVKDIVAANVFLAHRPDLSGVYNVACGGSITIRTLAETIIARTGSSSILRYVPIRPGDVQHSRASVEKIEACGFVPSVPFEVALQRTLAAGQSS